MFSLVSPITIDHHRQVLQMPSSHGLEGAAMAIQGLLKELAHTKFRQVGWIF